MITLQQPPPISGPHISKDSLRFEASIEGESEVFSSMLSNSRLISTKVFNSRVQGSLISFSTIAESACSGLKAHGAILHKVTAASTILEPKKALTLIDVIAETCELYGNWHLEGNARIHECIWHRKPRFLRIHGENGVDFGLTECKPGYAMLGCWCKPLKELLKAGPRLGQKHGWTEVQMREAREFFEMLLACPLDGVSSG